MSSNSIPSVFQQAMGGQSHTGEDTSIPGVFKEALNQQPETAKEAARRHTVRSGARVIETIAGAPKSAQETANAGITWLGEKLAGKDLPWLKKLLSYLPNPVGGINASSEDLRSSASEATKGYTEPRNNKEAFSDEVVSDAAAFMLAGPGNGGVVRGLTRALGTSLASNLAKEGVKSQGGSEGKQTGAKLGTMFMLSLLTHGNGVRNYSRELYRAARESLPENATVDAQSGLNRLNALRRQVVETGIPTATKTELARAIDDVMNMAQNGKFRVRDLEQAIHDLNERAQAIYGNELFQGNPRGARNARLLLPRINNVVEQELETYGQENPRFLRNFRNAQQARAALEQSSRVSRFIQRTAKTKMGAAVIGALFGVEGLSANPGIIIPTALGIGLGYGAVKGGELLARIMMSPQLSKYYFNVIRGAIQEDSLAVNKNLGKLDSRLVSDLANERNEQEK